MSCHNILLFVAYLHSHVWCSTNVISTYSWPCSDGLIFNSWGMKLRFIKMIKWRWVHAVIDHTSYRLQWCCAIAKPYLHGNICSLSGMALEVLVCAATSAPHQGNAGGAVDVLHLRRVFLHHLHQLLNGTAKAATPNLFKHKHCE